jgi:hypothetical protein
MWLVSKGRYKPFQEKIVMTPSCEVCNVPEEIIDHIPLHCPFARDFWNALGLVISDDLTLRDMQSLPRIQAIPRKQYNNFFHLVLLAVMVAAQCSDLPQ